MKYCANCHSTYPTDFSTCPKDQSPLRDVLNLAPGMVLRGKYLIEEKIGEGGMATVYRASHLHLHEELAIKLVSAALQNNADFLERFRREAIITRKLQHPNAVRLDDFDFTEDGRPFIAMEFVRGKSLRAALQESGHLPVARACHIARQVALALGTAHSLGIVHRDVKPDNVVLVPLPDGGDFVKVLDFGIAKAISDELPKTGYTPTATGLVLGTPHYLSPEQARGKRSSELDGRADLYSLGVMLYEMLTGELPFKSDTAIEMLLHHIQTQPDSAKLKKPELKIPEALAALVMKALEKDPSQRFQTGEEFSDALAAFDELPLGAPQRTPGGTPIVRVAPATSAASSSASAAAAATAAAQASAGETRVLGSASFTRQTPSQPAALNNAPAPPALNTNAQPGNAAASAAPRKGKKKYFIAAAIALFLIGGIALWRQNAAESRAPAPTDDLPREQVAQPQSRGTSRHSRRSVQQNQQNSNPYQQPDSQQQQAAAEQRQAMQARTEAQQLVSEGNRLMASRNFQAAASDYQQALTLDPNNSAARNGLKSAEAANMVQGIGSIFHH